jgi:hypothetical protein
VSPATPPSFFARLLLSWSCFFRVLFDPEFALRVTDLGRGLPSLPEPEPEPEPQKPAPDQSLAVQGALQVLALLQREGRLIDFLQQDITGFADAQIGVAARVVHQGCRSALGSLGGVAAVRSEPEGSAVTLDPSFDRASIKLTGNVQGGGPYRGVLRHKGWQAPSFTLPRYVGDSGAKVLAPAEVEL